MAFKREGHGKVKPAWRLGTHRPEGRMIGVEFEIEHRNGYQYLCDKLPEPKEEKNRPITERDGSLNDAFGVEIVFPPYKNAAFKSEKSYFARCLKTMEEIGVNAHVNCGMHMNVNTVGWEAVHRTRYVAFLHWLPATNIRHIGGRTPTHYCGQQPSGTLYDFQNHTTHVTCAGLRPNRIEVRFPLATTNLERVKNLTNFLELLEDWVKSPRAARDFEELDGTAWTTRRTAALNKFVAFLDANQERPRTSATIKGILLNGYQA